MSRQITRRDILRGTAAAVAGLALTGTEALAEGERRQDHDPNRRLRFGIIGCGGKGESGMADASKFGDILAIADVDAEHRSKGMLLHPRAACFDDYRAMLEAMRGKIDAVVISIPHHHAIAASMAMRQGLHTYCEKPLCRTIWEARQLGKIAKQKGVATQMGNQSTASTPMRKAAALIRRGDFGKPKEVHVWTDRAKGWWPQGVDRPKPGTPPKNLDFELWLGPRPARPFAEGYHPFSWRGWWDFGTGALGDMGCHIFNLPYMALDLRDPVAVQATTSGHNRDSFPESAVVHYEFPERNGRPALNLTWYDGGNRPPDSLVPGYKIGGDGSIVVCEKATIFSQDESNQNVVLIGMDGKFPDIEVDESPGHMAEFVRAALGGKPARSNFPDYASGLAETVLLGNLAVWANGPRVEWDAAKMEVKGSHEYDSLIHPSFNPGWSV
jgi:predicted dehydrogenase